MWPLILGGAAVSGLLYLNRDKPKPTRPALEEQPKIPRRQPVSPLAGVTPAQWKQFMLAVGDKSNVNKVSDTGHLGFFRFGYPRLADLGLVVKARREGGPGKKVWQGDFVPPLTRDGFLGNLGFQSRVFALSCGDFVTAMREQHPQDIGCSIEDTEATLSGLLGVMHRAGPRGYAEWVRNPADRKRYPNTTAAFKAANGLF